MANEYLANLRDTLDVLREQGELIVTNKEVNPDLEMAAIQKRLDGGPAILFENVKGYPDKRLMTNLFANRERVSRMFGVDDHRKLKYKIMDAIHNPLPPRLVENAPCQEVVVTKDIDVWKVVPMISHTVHDPGRTLGGGNTLISGKHFWGGTHVSFNRMNFRGPDYSSFQISPGSHTDQATTEWYRKGPFPMTINMGVPPAVTLMAGAGFMYQVLPRGCDELGIGGAVQGFPIDVVKAKTVDALSVANAEIVIEGYLDYNEKVWESPLAEAEQKQGVFPFHPEWSGYLGRAYRTYKFQVTAVTYRKDRAIYYPLIVHSFDDHWIDTLVREASFLEFAERISPGLVVDTHIPLGMTDWGGVIFQVKKRRKRDEGFQKNILSAALAASQGMRIGIAVDTDIDIYAMEDIIWALSTRVDGDKDIQLVAAGGVGQTFQPAERSAAAPGAQWVRSESKYSGGIAIDATVPFDYQWAYERAPYPVEKIELSNFFGKEDLAKALAKMPEYAHTLSRMGT